MIFTIVFSTFYHVHHIVTITVHVLSYFPFCIFYSNVFPLYDQRAGCALFSAFSHSHFSPFRIAFGLNWDLCPYQVISQILSNSFVFWSLWKQRGQHGQCLACTFVMLGSLGLGPNTGRFEVCFLPTLSNPIFLAPFIAASIVLFLYLMRRILRSETVFFLLFSLAEQILTMRRLKENVTLRVVWTGWQLLGSKYWLRSVSFQYRSVWFLLFFMPICVSRNYMAFLYSHWHLSSYGSK